MEVHFLQSQEQISELRRPTTQFRFHTMEVSEQHHAMFKQHQPLK
jgi:hypothetical protein